MPPVCVFDAKKQQTRSVAAHAISNPVLSQIEKRWEGMPPQEQADLWMALRDRMKNDWHELTLQERKAGERAIPGFQSELSSPHPVLAFCYVTVPIPSGTCAFDPTSILTDLKI